MEKNFVLNGNIDVGKFMGWEVAGPGIPMGFFRPDENKLIFFDELEFHSSWDWLMPVIKKIESLDYLVNICSDICTVTYAKHPTISGINKIDATYKAVIKFINWYNLNK